MMHCFVDMRLLGLCLLLLWAGCGPGKPPEVAEAEKNLPERIDFNLHIKPILSDRCFKCHGPDDNAREANLRLDTREGARAALTEGRGHAIVPGRLRKSEVFRRLVSDDPDYRMPPASSNLTISPEEIAYIAKWIEQGAEYKPHWSFIPPEKPAVPAVQDAAWPRDGIDHFVLARLEEKGWQPSEEASKETLIRRVTFDLTGLPPTLEEIDAFLADDAPDAYEKVVDRLLASEAYGERMANEWLDVARYADSHGYQDDGMRNMWPWRDWVIKAFNENMPYDRFITWQLAGDLLPAPTQEQILATAFNRNHMQSQEGGIVPEEYRVEYVADRTHTVGTALLGLTMECARCHDHKFDPISQKEYYQLFGFFNSVNETGQIPYAGEASPTVILKDEEAEAKLARLGEQIRALEEQVAPERFEAGYQRWLSRLEDGTARVQVRPKGLIGHYPLDEIRDGQLINRTDRSRPATLEGDKDKVPATVPGRFGAAQQLVGDSFIDMGDKIGYFERNEPFSISLWVNIQDSTAGPLVTRSGGIFNGNRGYDCMVRADGTLSASLNHVWPDNTIEVVTREPVPFEEWHHLVMTYDGSSRAAGIRLYLDGQEMAVKVVTDNLKKSILHTGDKTNWGGGGNLRLGRRHDETLDKVAVDEFMVFDRRLTPLEVAWLSGVEDPFGQVLAVAPGERSPAQEAALRDYYLAYEEAAYAKAFRQLTEVRGQENEVLTALPEVMVMRDLSEPRPTRVLQRGAYDAPREQVTPGTPSAVLGFPEDLPENRLGLARWLLDPRNPLTARVTVNRYWQMYFGRGIVATPEDFGNQGARPTHPLLLDWLATEFVDSGWDVKALQKRIVMSATYRQSSVAGPALRERDPANEWLARGPSYRMSAEMIRDNALAASGLLVRQVGGPSVKPYQPEGLWKELATRNATEYVQDHGDKLYRRSMYTIWKRTTPPPSMISFDAAERNACTVRRQRTSTPLQALVLLNDPQYVEAARVLAERVMQAGGAQLEDRITMAFRLLTSRRPRAPELQRLADLYAQEVEDFRADAASAQELLSVGEYPRDARLEAPEVAALTVVASTIMNFDEAVMKR